MPRIAHISDIHFGKIAQPGIVDALVADVNAREVDLVVASGDLTQRAFDHQFRAARAMLDAFDPPWMAVPGNHDVYPWWRLGSRLFDPLRRYRRMITPDLMPHRRLDGAVVQGINTAWGWTVMGGRVTAGDSLHLEGAFDDADPRDVRILTLHHHLLSVAELGDHDVSRGARRALRAAVRAGVEIILCGHLHISHVGHVEIPDTEHRIIIVSAGTATSTRGRRHHRKTNFYNLLDLSPESILIRERRFDVDAGRFEQVDEHRFER